MLYEVITEKRGTRKQHDQPVSGRLVEILVGFIGNIGQKSAENCLMHRRIKRAEFTRLFGFKALQRCPVADVLFFKNGADLLMNIPPFPHPPVGQIIRPSYNFV